MARNSFSQHRVTATVLVGRHLGESMEVDGHTTQYHLAGTMTLQVVQDLFENMTRYYTNRAQSLPDPLICLQHF